MNKEQNDDALDRLEAALGWQRKFGPMSSTQMDECVTSLATVREALERYQRGRAESAEAEVRRLTAIIRAHWSPEQADALLADSPSDGGGVRPADDPHSLVAKAILPEHTKEAS